MNDSLLFVEPVALLITNPIRTFSSLLYSVSTTTPSAEVIDTFVAVMSIPTPSSPRRSQITALSFVTFLVDHSISIVFPVLVGLPSRGARSIAKEAPAFISRRPPTQPEVLFQLNPARVPVYVPSDQVSRSGELLVFPDATKLSTRPLVISWIFMSVSCTIVAISFETPEAERLSTMSPDEVEVRINSFSMPLDELTTPLTEPSSVIVTSVFAALDGLYVANLRVYGTY